MAIIVEHKSNNKRYILVGSTFFKGAIWSRPLHFQDRMVGVNLVMLADESGSIHSCDANYVRVVEVDGQKIDDILANMPSSVVEELHHAYNNCPGCGAFVTPSDRQCLSCQLTLY